MKEEWRPVVGYEGRYEVSNHGRVRSLDRTIQCKDGRTQRWKGGIKKLCKNHSGYPTVGLQRDGKKRTEYVHRLVLEAFTGPCPEGMLARHLDDNPENNNIDNLKWGSPRDNQLDAVRNGRNYWSNKTHCDLGHEFIPENLRKNQLTRGYRGCLACHRAQAHVQRHPELQDQLQEVADKYYEAILKASTDAPVVGRHRDARTIMDCRRNERNEQQ